MTRGMMGGHGSNPSSAPACQRKRSFPSYRCTRNISCMEMGGNVRRPAVIRGKWAENRVPRGPKNAHFPHIAARNFPDARIWGKCTEKGWASPLARPACLRWGKENRVFTPVRQPPWRSAPRRPTSSWWGNANVSSESQDVVSGYRIDELLPDDFVETIEEFDRERMLRAETYDRVGGCTPIPL